MRAKFGVVWLLSQKPDVVVGNKKVCFVHVQK